jgi:UPF0716 protein FxsA
MWLLLLFIVLPAVELYLLITVGKFVGPLTTVGIIVLTGMLGWSLVKSQGLSTLARIRSETAQGRLPAEEMVAGLCLLATGLLLVTPGFLTDTVGFLVLIPSVRRGLARLLMQRFKMKIVSNGPFSADGGPGGFGGPVGDLDPEGGGRVDLGEGEVIDIPAENVKTYSPEDREDDGRDGR